ncbi:MAG: type 4a pilus biogenesis protein PilO [Kiritimatiellae bacterium]|jgi:Tfp pilus assembly protein PilO|nr:type 4a pilus biogenesis protein PilO [Kiritimatiellia bacterium]
MKISPREMTMVFVTVAIVVFGASYFVLQSRIGEWKKLMEQEKNLKQSIGSYRQMIAQKDIVTERLKEVSSLLPSYPADKEMDVYWMSVMDSIANKNNLEISRRQSGQETKTGSIYELPIECREWTGNLDSLVYFLFDLQKEGGMMDVRQLSIKPRTKTNLKGRFLLYCAYTREKTEASD